MHADLDKWLDEVWEKRTEIFKGFTQNGRAIHAEDINRHKGVGRIYKMYTVGDASGSGGTTGEASSLSGFLKAVADIVETRGAICVIQDSHWHTVTPEDLTALASGYSLEFDLTPRTDDDPDMCVISPESIVYDFIHVRHGKRALKETDQRIYLNLRAEGRGANFAAIVGAVYDHDGFRSSKVSCPGSAPRNDTALLYLAGEAAVNHALVQLREFQKTHAGAFLPGLPRLTSKIPELIGVGRGMEPPSYAVIRQGGAYYKKRAGMSFGWWRSALIFMALDRTYWTRPGQSDKERCTAFKRRAAKYFRAAGIDPDNPSVQTNPDSLPSYPE